MLIDQLTPDKFMNKKLRLAPNVRLDLLLAAAVSQAAKFGYSKVTRDQIAAAAECSPSLVSSYFGTMPKLRRTIVRAAVRESNLTIIGQALVENNSITRDLSDVIKKKALKAVLAAD